MQITLKALSALLSYPSADLKAAAAEVSDAIEADALLSDAARAGLSALLASLARDDLYELEETYVALFDRFRTLSLNLFEHVHGESRDRGGAMVDLLETYRAGGFEPATTELPDHLPVLLEFLAHRPMAEARDLLGGAAHILTALRERLARRDSPYAAVFAALAEIAAAAPDAEALAGLAAEPAEDPDDLEALDALWEETQVTFGPDPTAGCPATRDILARFDAPRDSAPRNAAPVPAE